MSGIIYKFTILAGVLYNGHKPYYIGQYVGDRFYSYWGSGHLWGKFIKGLRRKFPTCWKKLIKREILYQGNCTQAALDKLEEIYIRKEYALYSEKRGGCNILPGTANKFGSGSPMKDPDVARRVTEQLRGRRGAKRSKQARKNMSVAAKKSWIGAEKRRRVVGDGVRNYMKNGGAEYLSRVRKGHEVSEETRRKIKENHADLSGKNHPCYGKKFHWITDGKINRRILIDEDIPNGFKIGVTIVKKNSV